MMPAMRRSLLLLALPLVLSACGGSGGAESSENCSSRYWDGTVGTCLPQGWHVVEREVMRERGLPENAIVAFQADQATSGIFPSVVVMREALRKELDSPAYSAATIQSVQTLNAYQQVDLTDVEVEGDTVQMHTYIAQPNSQQPKQRYYQLGAVKGRNGYTFTAALPLSVEDAVEERVLVILQNVAFHDATTEK